MFRFLVVAIVLVPLSTLFLSELPSQSVVAQETYGISYLVTMKPFANDARERQYYQVVYSKGDSTITQAYPQRKLDSISSIRETTPDERNEFYSMQSFVIEINKDSLTYSDRLAGNLHIYREYLDFNWKLSDESKVIKGYDCKKATLLYGGRNWTAWYAPSVPINAGPYKFKSLPGLIVKMTDADQVVDFEINLFMKVGDRRMKRFEELNTEFEPLLTTREDFNAFHQSYRGLSLNESINYLNRDTPSTVQLMITTVEGEPMKDIDMDRKYKHNFIEIEEE